MFITTNYLAIEAVDLLRRAAPRQHRKCCNLPNVTLDGNAVRADSEESIGFHRG